MDFKTYTRPPKSGGKPKSIVILLHGMGANGQDLMSLAPIWADSLPDTVFVAPDAPYPCDMAPVGYQWFSLQDWSPQSVLEGVERAEPFLNNYIDEMLQRYELPNNKTALVGFSQGTMMSLYVGPRRKNPIAGVLAYSGALVGAETLGSPDVHKVPVCLIHGNMDMVLPVQYYHDAKMALEANGFPLTGGVTQGLPHGIDEAGIEDGAAFLRQILAA